MYLVSVEDRTMTGKLTSNRGQSIIEFAYVLPLMVIIALGIIEFGVLFYDQAVVTNASREGARAGMTFETDGGGNYWSETEMQAKVEQTVNDYLQGRLVSFGPLGTITILSTRTNQSPEYDYDAYLDETEGRVEVVVAYQHTYLAIPNFFGWGDTINLSATTTMRLE
jgi:Flp pilus assembly protein TadG